MLVKNGVCFADGRFTSADVRLHGGKIAAVGQLEAEPGEEVQDAAGLFVLPGFVDIHIHAFGGADCMRGEADVRRMSDGLLETGVAAFVPTTMSAWPEQTYEALCSIQAVMDRPQPRGAAVLGAHMEAPFLSPKYKGAQLEACLSLPSAEAYEAMVRGLSCVRMMTLAPELPGAGPLIAYLKARGVVTCAAHSAASAAQARASSGSSPSASKSTLPRTTVSGVFKSCASAAICSRCACSPRHCASSESLSEARMSSIAASTSSISRTRDEATSKSRSRSSMRRTASASGSILREITRAARAANTPWAWTGT